jgi:6,7-dimethyl-8-ribityllumazine synthase
MATEGKNLSEKQENRYPNVESYKVAIVVAKWNEHITLKLLEGAKLTLMESGVAIDRIHVEIVPGAFELPFACLTISETKQFDGIIAIGCVIQGETRHFDFVCEGTTMGIQKVMLDQGIPISFCVLTDQNEQQSIDRAGGKHGNKGVESAYACLEMIAMKKRIAKNNL